MWKRSIHPCSLCQAGEEDAAGLPSALSLVRLRWHVVAHEAEKESEVPTWSNEERLGRSC